MAAVRLPIKTDPALLQSSAKSQQQRYRRDVFNNDAKSGLECEQI